MSKKPSHRGAAPQDHELLDARHLPALRAAMRDLCWLLDRGYAINSSAELVGNRHELTARQRMAVVRSACSTELLRRRAEHRVDPTQLRGRELWLDGFNVLMAVEVALAGGVILLGRDGCCRDVAGVHARYCKVEETGPALKMIGEMTGEWGVTQCWWYLDRPVSNSGRLRSLILDVARTNGWNWDVTLEFNPDKVLAQSNQIIASADSAILDRCQRWVNLTRLVIARHVPQAKLLDLGAA